MAMEYDIVDFNTLLLPASTGSQFTILLTWSLFFDEEHRLPRLMNRFGVFYLSQLAESHSHLARFDL